MSESSWHKFAPRLLLVLASFLVFLSDARGDDFLAIDFTPAANADSICIDTPLYITFNQAPHKRSGFLRVFKADGTLVDTINVSDTTESKMIGGFSVAFKYYPIIITDNTAAIYLHQALEYDQTYYVLIDAGAFLDADGDAFGISDAGTWRFSTSAAGPPPGTTQLTVAADGSGDFCTVQGAIDFVPVNNTERVTINVNQGTYTEIVYVRSNKPFISLVGEDRDQTVIEYPNNNNLNGAITGLARAMFGVDANDFVLENITLHNTTPHGGSQAEAFRTYGQRTVINRSNLKSFQDTLLQNGTAFITNSYIEGDVDYMWGFGSAFFQNSELKAVTSNGYYTQIRNTQGHNGNVFVNCSLTRSSENITGSYLSRIDPNAFPYSQVLYINSAMDAHIRPQGWLLNTTPANDCSKAPNIQFWEYHSSDLTGDPVDVSQRLACSRQLSDDEATQWTDPAFVLNGWVPNTLNASPDAVSAGESIIVNWSAPQGHSCQDWIGLYPVGADDADYVDSQYAGDGTTGITAFIAPCTQGQYEFRYFTENSLTRVATSNTVAVQ